MAGLPVQLTPLIGRESEIASVAELLASARLVTLTGVGGAGKTRLAAGVAEQAAPDYDLTAWVDLAGLSDAALVDQVVAVALGVREEGGRSPLGTLVTRLGERSAFVILDNCEHLVDACAVLADALLRGCPHIRILATSREALGVTGEQAWLVPPLSLPAAKASAATVLGSEAGQLFLARARAALPTFTLDDANARDVAKICRRLDGIPLAIELAAARVRVLVPGQIAERLNEAFTLLAGPGRTTVARHRTLREAIDWSHALLEDAEATLFRRLSVFAGTFSLDAVEALCSEQGLDLLSALVDKSLVVMESTASEARYRLLETLRQYGRQKLADAGEEAEMRRRHAHFFTELAAARERDTFGGAGDPEWSGRLVLEEPNLRAASEWAEAAGDGATALRLCVAMHWHWYARGNFREGWQRLETALTHAEESPPLEAGKAYAAAATTAYFLGKLDRIVPNAERAVVLLRTQDDPWYLAYALSALGLGLLLTEQDAEPALTEAALLARTHAPRSVLLAFALYWQGRHALEHGDLDLAERVLTECHVLGRELRHPPAIAHPLASLGLVLIERGALGTAQTHLGDALRIHAGNSDLLGCLWSFEGLARIARRTGAFERGAQLLAFARVERDRSGAGWSPPEHRMYATLATALEEALGAEAYNRAVARGEALTLADAVTLALETDCSKAEPARSAPGAALTVEALGPLRILKDGVLLDPEAWTAAKPRELLLYLLCHPDGRTREQVGVAFWPEASAEQVRNNFHVTLHRLRKALGVAQWISHSGERYALDPALPVHFDAARFERDVTAGMAQLRQTGNSTQLEAALALYRGDFLEHDAAGDWHVEVRDRLRHKHLSALAALAEHRMRQERWADAAELWHRLMGRDGLDEQACRGLMTCHARLGQRARVQQVYQRLETELERELDARPGAETTRLYQQLVT